MSVAVFWMSAAGIFGSNTNTFGPKRVELALEVEPPGATTGMSAPSAATATRTDTVDRVFQTIVEAPESRPLPSPAAGPGVAAAVRRACPVRRRLLPCRSRLPSDLGRPPAWYA